MTAPERGDQSVDRTPVDVADLIPVVRRIVVARVGADPIAEDLVQETLARVLAARPSVKPGMLQPYAIATARNVVATMRREAARKRRNEHRVLDLTDPESPDTRVLLEEEHSAMAEALGHLSEQERRTLLEHEVDGTDTKTLADRAGSSPGAVAAHLNRIRARLRVEYVLAAAHLEPPTERCRPVLVALSSGDQRRQREVDALGHLLDCDVCASLSPPLLERGQQRDDSASKAIDADCDIVAARRAARELASRLEFNGTDLTIIATAVSEVCRNIVRFAGSGTLTITVIESPRRGIQVIARDAGPGIGDIEQALEDGFSTYGGLGLGLPGVRRLMDEFELMSEPGSGTTVSMTKWERTRRYG